jgi:uncharacterized membrane protein YbhN (UPF0104 family)
VTARRAGLAIGGILVGGIAFLLTFWKLGWSGGPTLSARAGFAEIAQVIARAKLSWLLTFLFVNALSIPLRGWQLRALARRSDGERPPFLACARAVAVGNLAHNLLPARLGEAARAIVVSREGDVSLPRSASALFVGRVLDLLLLLAVCFALPIALGLGAAKIPSLRAVAESGSFLAAGLVAIFGVLWVLRKRAARWGKIVAEFLDGLSSVREAKRAIPAILASIGAPVALALSTGCAERALRLDLPDGSALVVTGLYLLGVAVPSAPASLGVYHAIVAATLVALGATNEQALGFALMTHVTVTAMNIALGALALATARGKAVTQPAAEVGREAA